MCKTVYIYDASRHGSYLGGATTVPLPLEKIFTTRFTLLNSCTTTRSSIKENFFWVGFASEHSDCAMVLFCGNKC